MAESTCPSTSTSEPPSILSRLRSPALSDLSRKRKVDANRVPPLGKKRASSQALNATYVRKSVKPAQRAHEFPGEHLVESVGSLFCRACRECLCVKRRVVLNHMLSRKHEEGKLKLKQIREAGIAQPWKNMIVTLTAREKRYLRPKRSTGQGWY